MTIDNEEVNSVAGSDGSLSKNQAENSPSPMPTTEPPQTIDLETVEGSNAQKKRKVRETPTVTNANDGDTGKRKPCRPKYCKYWGDVTKMNMLVFVAVIFDPRRKFQFIKWGLTRGYEKNVADSLCEKVKETLYKIFESYRDFYNEGQAEIVTQEIDLSDVVSSSRIDDAFDRDMDKDETMSKNEVDLYLTEPREQKSPDFDILNWWKVNSTKYPTLGLMARDILAMPISTVASESAFSTGGRVLCNYRSSLTPQTVEALICAQNWLRSSPLSVDLEELLEELEKLEEELAPIPQLNEGLSDFESDED